MLGIKTNKAPIRGEFAKKLREEIAVALSERKQGKNQELAQLIATLEGFQHSADGYAR